MKISEKLYKLHVFKNRNIEAVFAHMPYKRVSTGTRDIAEAVIFCENFLKNEGILGDKIPLFSEFAKDFYIREDKESLRYRHKQFDKEKRKAWYTKNQGYLDYYIMPYFSVFPLTNITQIIVENWLISLEGKREKQISGNYRSKILQALRLILDDAVRYSYIKTNPTRGQIMLPSMKKKKEKRPLTLHEQRTLFPQAKEERLKVWENILYATYFSVMYDTGFRPEEVQALRVSDVYTTPQGMGVFTTHTICYEEHIEKEQVKTSGEGMESRVGLLTKTTSDLILELIDNYRLKDNDHLFLTKRMTNKKSWINGSTANRRLRKACRENGLATDLTQYCLRHTYATSRRGNMDEATLALSMGHSGGRVRNDYDHRTASILLAQLEKSRDAIFSEDESEEEIKPLKEKRG